MEKQHNPNEPGKPSGPEQQRSQQDREKQERERQQRESEKHGGGPTGWPSARGTIRPVA